jgi:hypothetical protein
MVIDRASTTVIFATLRSTASIRCGVALAAGKKSGAVRIAVVHIESSIAVVPIT